MTTIKHIDWARTAYEDQLLVRLRGGAVERAEWHTVLQGRVYAVVQRGTNVNGYFSTYIIGPDGTATDANSGMGNFPLHYELQGHNVLFRSCNDSGEPPRRRRCTMCQARSEAA